MWYGYYPSLELERLTLTPSIWKSPILTVSYLIRYSYLMLGSCPALAIQVENFDIIRNEPKLD